MSSLHSGAVFANRFEIDRAAGSGGMGTVYRARDQLSGDFVALKLVSDGRTEVGDGERFAREAQLLAELRHPGIVSHVAHGLTKEGQRFLVMKWLDGEDLAQRLARGPLPLREALTLISQLAQSLAFAHERKVIHRDLKPTNIFLPGGNVSNAQILDFGIARRLDGSRAMTRTGMIVGTPEYMAPEQARGVRELTPAADLFSLGCVFYECLTGEPPFVAAHLAAVLVRILFEEPTPVTQRRPGIPNSVSELLRRLLTKDPAQRIGDAREVISIVERIGELTDLPLLPTLAAGAKNTPPLPDSEQVLMSLVVALSPRDAEGSGSTVLPAAVPGELRRHETILAELRFLGAQADLLIGGALVATVPQMASAKDQATLAARCAVKVHEHWPEAQVVVVTGRGSRSREGLTGEVLDRAWRLLSKPDAPQAAGATAQIRIDEVSAGLLEGHFELSPVHALSGAYELGTELLDPDAGRLLLGKSTPCVGRERELTTLLSVYNECKDELLARAVLVLGQPGLGKSRLRHEFVRRLSSRGEPMSVLLGRGDPMKTKSAYGILGDALRQWLEVRTGQSLDDQRTRIRDRIGTALPAADAPRVTAFLGEICGVPFPDDESSLLRAARQDPRIMSDQVEQAFIDVLQLFRATGPLLLIVEDLHWSDALTVKLVDAALRRLRDHAFMVLALARPEVQDSYPNLWSSAVQLLPLHPLARKAGERLVHQLLGAELPPDEVARIVEQSAGNPLFLEELIRVAAQRKSGEIPETVAAMIQARLGGLSAGTRRTLRAASVFGEAFWESGVRSLLQATHADAMTESTISDLLREEIIEKTPERRFANETQYRFRHALVRDAAYGLLGAEEKLAWHAAAGAFLEAVGDSEAVVLAEHFRLGQETARAVRCDVRAAEQSYEAGDMGAALGCIHHGMACGAASVERGKLLAIETMICMWRGEFAQVLSSGQEALPLLSPGSKSWCRVFEALFPVMGLMQPTGLPPLILQFTTAEPTLEARATYVHACTWQSVALGLAGQKDACSLLLKRVQQVGHGLMDKDFNVRGHVFGAEGAFLHHICHLPYRNWYVGHEATCALRAVGNRPLEVIMGAHEGKSLLDLGQRKKAGELLAACLALAEQLQDGTPLGYARAYMARFYASSDDAADWDQAEAQASKLLELQNLTMLAQARATLAKVHFRRGNIAVAESEAHAVCELLLRFPAYRAEVVALWSRILAAQGRAEESLKVCETEAETIATLGLEGSGLLDLYAALADAHIRCGNSAAARAIVERALPILEKRAADISDFADRAVYLHALPENARLLALAALYDLNTQYSTSG